jgi:glycosyltransferase involved in cell wall biosynthesis
MSKSVSNGIPVLFVDATGALQSFGIAPTGIPRVEEGIVRAALADRDPRVKVVRFDRWRRSFRGLTAAEARILRESVDLPDIDDRVTIGKVHSILALIRRKPTLSRDADRCFADLTTNRRRRGASYAAAKLFFRAYRLIRLALLLTTSRAAHNGEKADSRSGVVLLSNPVWLGSRLQRVLGATKRRALIHHDLIPISHPEFAIDPSHAHRFAENLERILRAGCEILCTSQASQTRFRDYLRESRIPEPPISRFPMPSLLREDAAETSRMAAEEPFALYCSTIEVRKNHLMLMRLWRRAMDEGVAFPKLICVGKWGWGIDDLIEYLAGNPSLSSRVVFTGPTGDRRLVDYYRRALFGVVPSHVEGWGFGASECLDFGVPVIVSTTPALREATRGLMPAVDPDDADGWFAAIRRMTEDGRWRDALRRTIAERHRPTPIAAAWERIKEALLNPPAVSREPADGATARSAFLLSVVVTTRDPAGEVVAKLGSLSAQVRAVGGELIVVSGAVEDAGELNPDGVRIHRLPGASIFHCRAAALSFASADIVALTEDHCVQADDWCARILENFATRPELVLLGGTVANGSTTRIDDLMNFWATFAPYAPGQVTARHPCVAHFIVRSSAIRRPVRPGELEGRIIQTFEKVPGALHVDPALCVTHVQSHGFWNTFAVHFHNGRATAALSPRRLGSRNLPFAASIRWTLSGAKAHLRRSGNAFMRGTKSVPRSAGYLLLILPLVLAHAAGEFVGYRRGAGSSLDQLV